MVVEPLGLVVVVARLPLQQWAQFTLPHQFGVDTVLAERPAQTHPISSGEKKHLCSCLYTTSPPTYLDFELIVEFCQIFQGVQELDQLMQRSVSAVFVLL